MKQLKDKFWIWGHPPASCNDYNVGENKFDVTPAQGARYMGAKNIFYVAFGHPMDISEYSKDMQGINTVGLAVENWGELKADCLKKTLELSKQFTKLDRLVFDDFFGAVGAPYRMNWLDYTIEELVEMRDKIHEIGCEMWVVLYQAQCNDERVSPYLDVFDGVSFWFWNEPTIIEYHKSIAWLLENTIGKKRLVGCYLFNFGLNKPATPELVKYQLDCNRLLIKNGQIDGVILHNNALGGMNLAAYEEAKKWMDEFGDEQID